MQFFYDGQIRRYITQIVRAFSRFSYQDSDGVLVEVPVMYGDITRQVASIIRDNSENKMPSAPRMGVYITGLEMDRTRSSDASFVSKINLREKEYDEATQAYYASQTKGYTVERLHPTPYTLSINIDIWSSNTEQKLQILEQILMLFNPSMEIQTTDNYIDWTSISVLNLENINFSSRSIPVGAADEIDVATLGLTAPIYISPPVKVKKLGIITDIITSIFNQDTGSISLEGFNPPTDSQPSAGTGTVVLPDGTIIDNTQGNTSLTNTVNTGETTGRFDLENPFIVSYRNYDLVLEQEVGKLGYNRKLRIGDISWTHILEAELPAKFQPGISQLRLRRAELINPIVGTFDVDPLDNTKININFDQDSLPQDTILQGPVKTSGSINGVIDPISFNPTTVKTAGIRYLILNPIGYRVERKLTPGVATIKIDTDIDYIISSSSVPGRTGDETVTDFVVFVNNEVVSATKANENGKFVINLDTPTDPSDEIRYVLGLNEDGADAWKNADGSDFTADDNDIIEWDGSKWHIIWDASENSDTTYVTNLKNNTQLYWNNYYWQNAIDGIYPRGTWSIVL